MSTLPILPPSDGSYGEHGREIFDDEDTSTASPASGSGSQGKGKVPKKVARAMASNIKTMLMGREGSWRKRKEVGG